MHNQLDTLHKLRNKIDIQPRGLVEKTKLTDGEFKDLFKSLNFTQDSMFFLIGDYLNLAEKRYGTTYKNLMESSGYALSTLQQAKWTCKNLPIEKRHASLSYSHHKEALMLTKFMGSTVVEAGSFDDAGNETKAPVLLFQMSAINYLNRASQEKLSVAKMRKLIRQTLAGKSGVKPTPSQLEQRDKAFAEVVSYIQYLSTTIANNEFSDKQQSLIKSELNRIIDNIS